MAKLRDPVCDPSDRTNFNYIHCRVVENKIVIASLIEL